ncbi:hypothetical protein ACHAWF_015616 [Thalassiosira exigua]
MARNSSSITPRSRPPGGIVARMTREREGNQNTSAVGRMVKERESGVNGSAGVSSSRSAASASVGREVTTINGVKLAKGKVLRRARMQGVSSATLSASGSEEAPQEIADRYHNGKDGDDESNNSGDSRGGGSKFLLSAAQRRISKSHSPSPYVPATTPKSSNRGVPKQAVVKNVVASSGASASTPTSAPKYHIGLLPSLLTDADDATIDSTDVQMMETHLYKKFEEAFTMTLNNNPGILPGAPTVVDSIKSTLLKVQKSKAQKEKEMRQQLEKAKKEKDQLEAQLRKEMGAAALHKNELTKELEVAKKGKFALQESLSKQMEAIIAVKKEMQLRMDNVTREKEGLTEHLGHLSKSRAELEKALQTEMEMVEKARDALQTVVAERKKLQKQKAENTQMEAKIEGMTQAANKEKRALQAEVEDLKKFEEHIAEMRQQNDTHREELEQTKSELKQMANDMQTKKCALMESKTEMEAQYQKEIDELECKIQETKLMNEQELEKVVKNRVMSYLRGGGGGLSDVSGPNDTHKEVAPKDDEHPLDIEALVQSRVEAELQARMEADLQSRMEAEAKTTRVKVQNMNDIEVYDDETDTKENRAHRGGDVMRREIDRLREELELVQSRNVRRTFTPRVESRDERDDMRREIESIRDEIGMPPTYSSPSPRHIARNKPGFHTSPRYAHHRTTNRGYGEHGSYFGDEDIEERMRRRHHLASTSPLRERSPRTRRGISSPRYYY